MSERLTGFWIRVQAAREIIDEATEDGSYATLSSRTDPDWELVHWKTAEALAERLPRVYQINRAPGGDRRIRNARMIKRMKDAAHPQLHQGDQHQGDGGDGEQAVRGHDR